VPRDIIAFCLIHLVSVPVMRLRLWRSPRLASNDAREGRL
jgi:hypothetical protein